MAIYVLQKTDINDINIREKIEDDIFVSNRFSDIKSILRQEGFGKGRIKILLKEKQIKIKYHVYTLSIHFFD